VPGDCSSGNQCTVRLPYGRGAVPLARRQLVADLAARRVPPQVVEEAESVVAELVTDGGGCTRPAPLRPADFAVSGRGLRIVRSLAHEWGVLDGSPAQPGHTVWASVGGPSRRRTC
jgi:serine/threonine-protein kinase RsbW